MNVHLPAPRRGWPARLVILAVVVVVLAVAAATFVLSYTGVHEIALRAGVAPRLARIYPGVFDAVLVIACVAAVMLRDARWWARGYAWLVIIVVIGVVGAADATHAMNVALPQRKTEGVVAAAPWVLVLLGFSLLLTMLRQSRGQHATAAAAPPAITAAQASHTADQPALPPATPVERPTGLARHPAAPALPAAAMPAEHEAQPTPDAPDMPDLADAPDHADHADQTPFAEPQAEDHPPTLEIPTFAEPCEPPTASVAEFGGHGADDDPAAAAAPGGETAEPDAHAATQEAAPAPSESAEEETAAFRYTPAPTIWPTGDTLAEAGAGAGVGADAGVAPRTRSVPGWIERVADSGDPPMQRHDYWDTDDDGGLPGTSSASNGPGVPVEQDTPLRASPFTTVPRLNRVRATPIPPEEDDEASLP